MEAVAERIRRRHDIDVGLYRASSDALTQRMIEEKRCRATAARTSSSRTRRASCRCPRRGLSPRTSRRSSPGSFRDRSVTAGSPTSSTRSSPRGTQTGSRRVRNRGRTRTSPTRDGRAGSLLEADDSDWYKTLREHLAASGKTPAEADRIFSGIARNATFVNGHTLMTQLVASGEFDITPHAYLHTVEDMRRGRRSPGVEAGRGARDLTRRRHRRRPGRDAPSRDTALRRLHSRRGPGDPRRRRA